MHILRRIPYYGFLVLLVYMPFHIFLAQWLSLATGGLDAWKIGKDVVLLVLVLFTICLVLWQRKGSRAFFVLLGLAVLYGLLHLVLWAFNPDIFTTSAALGVIYNTRLPCFLLLGFGAYLLNQDKFVFSSVIKIVLGVTSVVAAFGVLQYFLPKDLLTHVGYGLERGTRAAFFIDDNPALPRVFSTLREPNALGAFLIVPITMLTALIMRIKDGRRPLLFGMLLLQVLAVVLTFSRSAWLGVMLAVSIVIWWNYRKGVASMLRRFWPLLIGLVLLGGIGLYAARNTGFVSEYITHSTEEAVEDLDSNDYHVLLIKEGLEGVADQPLGHGPGTAGLASIQDPNGGQLTENYYIQIAYEVGILGLLLFLAINIFVYIRLWRRGDWIGASLIAAFWGYVLMNMLLHTWSNEAVAAQWWLLAGAAIAYGRSASTKNREAS